MHWFWGRSDSWIHIRTYRYRLKTDYSHNLIYVCRKLQQANSQQVHTQYII